MVLDVVIFRITLSVIGVMYAVLLLAATIQTTNYNF